MHPRSEAIAFRIWAIATPLGWDCTASDVARALGDTTVAQVRRIASCKGWTDRMRPQRGNLDATLYGCVYRDEAAEAVRQHVGAT